MSSWCTVAKLKWGVLPRMLISFSSCVIVSTGYETRVTSPPVKNGLMSWRSGVCIASRHTSLASGAIVTLVTSFDVNAHTMPNIELYGTGGSLLVPDPNTFGGPVRLRKNGAEDWQDVALTHGYAEHSRGLGIADMVAAIKGNRPHRANGELAFHALDIMQSIHESSATGKHIVLESTCAQPAAMPAGAAAGTLNG